MAATVKIKDLTKDQFLKVLKKTGVKIKDPHDVKAKYGGNLEYYEYKQERKRRPRPSYKRYGRFYGKEQSDGH